jgi:hypothetical protein
MFVFHHTVAANIVVRIVTMTKNHNTVTLDTIVASDTINAFVSPLIALLKSSLVM